MRPAVYTHTRVLAAPHARATSADAQMLSRLADKAVALAIEHGEVLTRREAIQRSRENLMFVRALAGAGGVKETEYRP